MVPFPPNIIVETKKSLAPTWHLITCPAPGAHALEPLHLTLDL